MPSRRPPSQRDPAYALHRLVGTVAQAAPGLKVKNAAPVRPPAPTRPPTTESEAVFSTATMPVAGQSSPPYGVNRPCTALRFRVFLSTAGTTSTTVKLYLNGTEIASVTLASGAVSGSVTFAATLAGGDVLTVAATVVGTADGMTAIAYLAA